MSLIFVGMTRGTRAWRMYPASPGTELLKGTESALDPDLSPAFLPCAGPFITLGRLD